VAIPQAPDYRGETELRADERITRYETVVGEHPTRAGLANILGSLAYGMADTPRVEQIRNGMDYFRAERQRQRVVSDRIAALRKANTRQP